MSRPVLTADDVADHYVSIPLWLEAAGWAALAVFIGCVGAGVAQIIRTRF